MRCPVGLLSSPGGSDGLEPYKVRTTSGSRAVCSPLDRKDHVTLESKATSGISVQQIVKLNQVVANNEPFDMTSPTCTIDAAAVTVIVAQHFSESPTP
jgi:hypothetical protein